MTRWNFDVPDGKCFVCGKPTKLPIHQDCGEKSKDNPADPRPKRSRKRDYARKKLPGWMK